MEPAAKRRAPCPAIERAPPDVLTLLADELSISDVGRLRCASKTMCNRIDALDSVLRDFASRVDRRLTTHRHHPAAFYASFSATRDGDTAIFCREYAQFAIEFKDPPLTIDTLASVAPGIDHKCGPRDVARLVAHLRRSAYTLSDLRRGPRFCSQIVGCLASLADLDQEVAAFRKNPLLEYLGARCAFDSAFFERRCAFPFDVRTGARNCPDSLWAQFWATRRELVQAKGRYPAMPKLYAFLEAEFERTKRSPSVRWATDNRGIMRTSLISEAQRLSDRIHSVVTTVDVAREGPERGGPLNSLQFVHIPKFGDGFTLRCVKTGGGELVVGIHSFVVYSSHPGELSTIEAFVGVLATDGEFICADSSRRESMGEVLRLEHDTAEQFGLLQKLSLFCGWCGRDHSPRCTP